MTRTQMHTPWHTASSLVGSGFDRRSSDNGLLSILYGSLERTHHFNWLNAGRTLVDKTYLHLLFQAKALPLNGITHHEVAPPLELFVRANLQPIWSEMAQMSATQKQQKAVELVNLAASTLFGSSHQTQAASWLLFYLCPHLPIFPITQDLHTAINQEYTVTPSDKAYQAIDCYQDYQSAAQDLYSQCQPLSQCELPTADYGTAKEQAIIADILEQSDWWHRHCFLQYLLTLEK